MTGLLRTAVGAASGNIASLPGLQGYGDVYDPHQAMVRDASGDLQGLVEDFVAETDPAMRTALMEDILFLWTGSDGICTGACPSTIQFKKKCEGAVRPGRLAKLWGGIDIEALKDAPLFIPLHEIVRSAL